MNPEQIYRIALGLGALAVLNSLESVNTLSDSEKKACLKLHDYLLKKELSQ